MGKAVTFLCAVVVGITRIATGEEGNPVCASPPHIDGAFTPQLSATQHSIGTAVIYSCPSGYVAKNILNQISLCILNTETGRPEWTVPDIACNRIFCSVPPNPINGRAQYSSLEYGSELKYQCNAGYRLKNYQPRICSEDATWSNDEPECIEAACEEPQPPKHGSVKLHGDLKVGSLATYSCDPDRKLYGATTTKCLISGKWIFDAPECLRSCKVPLIENGEMGKYETRYIREGSQEEFKKVSRGQTIDSRQTLFLRCKNGAMAFENSVVVNSQSIEVTCSDGIWSRDIQCKTTQCVGEPPETKNGNPEVGKRDHGFTIYYMCSKTTTKKITGNVTCYFGSWIGNPPRCLIRPCYTASLTFPGLVKPREDYFDSDDGFQINCAIGYRKLASKEDIMCVRGKWEVSENPCISEAEESSIIATTEKSHISHGGGIQPSTNVELSTPRTIDATHNRECVCTYVHEDSQVKVQIGNKVLKKSDTIKLGETVSMECKYASKRLKWNNDLVFNGTAYMTCSRCKKWEKEDLPTCTRATSNTFITHDGDLKILPGGIVDIRMGERSWYACWSTWGPPIWDFGERKNVYTFSDHYTVQGESIYVIYLDIIQASEQHNGKYECFMRSDHGSHIGSTFLDLQVHGSCKVPVIENGEMGRYETRYVRGGSQEEFKKVSRGQTIDSRQTLFLRCKNGAMAFENAVVVNSQSIEVTCSDGIWSRDIQCKTSGCEVPYIYRGSIREEILEDKFWNWNKFRFERTIDYLKIPSGTTVYSLHGTVLWFYCDAPYSVHGKRSQRVLIRCLKGKWSTKLQCLLEGEILVKSTVATILNTLTTVPEIPLSSSFIANGSLYHTTTSIPTDLVSVGGYIQKEVVTHPATQGPPVEECFCEYFVEDTNIVAHADGRRLIVGDRVQNGSTILFHCLYVGYHRFRGHREITCIGCQSWDSSDFPSCISPEKGDAAILFNKDINILPDGKIEVHIGQRVKFTCVAMEIAQFPEWITPEVPGISIIRERRERKDYGDVVYLNHLEIQNADYGNEGTYNCYIDENHKSMLQVVITDPNLRCPELLDDGKVIIRYSMERRENSKVSFSCPRKGQELIGKPILTCLRSGQWSDPPPYCSGMRCKVLKANDMLQIDYSKEREIGSYAAFHCPLPGRRFGVLLTHCLENGTWEHPIPACRIPDCMFEDLLSSVPPHVLLMVNSSNNRFIPYNSTVKLVCADSMVTLGDPQAKCSKEAKWIIDTVECSNGCHAPIKPPTSRLILTPEADIYKIWEKVTLSCPPGMILNTESQVVMCMTSEPIFPDCIENDFYAGADRRRT